MTSKGNDIYFFDREGRLSGIRSQGGKSISISYAEGEMILKDDVSGKQLHIFYNEDGLMERIADDSGREAVITYMIDFFVNEYKEDEWDAFTNCFDELDICIEGIPHDIVNSVLTILGSEDGYNWLHKPLHKFNGKSAMELLKTSDGTKALKALIMRLPN